MALCNNIVMEKQLIFPYFNKYKKINKIYYHCSLWEDLQNGQYKTSTNEDESILENLCIELLSSKLKTFKSMKGVVQNWNYSMRENISNIEINRQAWLGQAACCYQFSAPDYITKRAWFKLSQKQRDNANKIADKIIKYAESIIRNDND